MAYGMYEWINEANEWLNGELNEWFIRSQQPKNVLLHEWMNECMNEQMNESLNETKECMNLSMNVWIDYCMNE